MGSYWFVIVIYGNKIYDLTVIYSMIYNKVMSIRIKYNFEVKTYLGALSKNVVGIELRLTRNARLCNARSDKVGLSHCYSGSASVT